MELYFEEKQAIYYFIRQIVRADGVLSPVEHRVYWGELMRMYFNPNIIDMFDKEIVNSVYSISDALAEIHGMTDEKKKYVSALLTVFVNLDEGTTPEGFEEERGIVDFIPKIYEISQLPKMSFEEAIGYLNEVGEMESWESPILNAIRERGIQLD